MVQIAIFHHAQGLTAGVRDFAQELRDSGHIVDAPDLFDGNVFDTLDEGIAYAQKVGFGAIMQRGKDSVEQLPQETVYIGFSMGVMAAQALTQTRPGALGAVFCHACMPISEFSPEWPADVPVQIHGMDADDWFVADGDIDAARELEANVSNAQLYIYPGDQHLFADSSLAGYNEKAARLLMQRVKQLLDTL